MRKLYGVRDTHLWGHLTTAAVLSAVIKETKGGFDHVQYLRSLQWLLKITVLCNMMTFSLVRETNYLCHEGGGNRVLQNADQFLADYILSYPGRQ